MHQAPAKQFGAVTISFIFCKGTVVGQCLFLKSDKHQYFTHLHLDNRDSHVWPDLAVGIFGIFGLFGLFDCGNLKRWRQSVHTQVKYKIRQQSM